MTRISLQQPSVAAQSVTFQWHIDPATPLFRRHDFTLEFPGTVDVAQIPVAAWWTVFLVCMHSLWPLLRPCSVTLPIRLQPGERSFWERLVEAESTTLDAYRKDGLSLGTVSISDNGPALDPLPQLPASARCASAFSGGKDSLLSAGILSEFTERPVLVTTTSPMAGKSDQSTARRREVLAQIQARRDLTLVEVRSDFRSCYNNSFSAGAGYGPAVNEISDTFLYFASLLSVGAAFGIPHLFLASEAEVQENVSRGGVIVQHPHYMYSTVTQRALQTLLRPAAIWFSSLTSPLHNAQVQQLLWRRYHDLSGLQYSCWRIGPDEVTCSRCRDCFRLALCALFVGGNPQRMGIDLVKLLCALRDWAPRSLPEADPETLLPNELLRPANDRQIVQYIQRVPLRQIYRLLGGLSGSRLAGRTRDAMRSYAQLRRRVADYPAEEPLGYRPNYLAQVDPLLRGHVGSVYAEYFKAEPAADYDGILSRGDTLVKWICEPLVHARGN